jgi:hypothetical protein
MRVKICSVILIILLAGLLLGCSDKKDPTQTFTSPVYTPPEITGNTYYVANNGDDSNPGTLDLPWRTIQKAADEMQAGDGVYIRGGIYYENIRTENNGTVDNYILFAAYHGEIPIIDGSKATDSNNGFIINNSYIKLHGLKVCNWMDTGIWMDNAAYIEIIDCEVYDVVFGIGASNGTHDFVLRNVSMHHFDLFGFDASPSGGNDCYNGTFIDCVAHTGRDPDQNVDGFALGHGNQHSFTFTRCKTYDVFDGFDLSADDVILDQCVAFNCLFGGFKLWGDNITVLNCLSYNNGSSNLELDWRYWNNKPKTVMLVNCTFYGGDNYNIWVENSGDSLHMYNCIIAGNGNIGLAFEQMGVKNYKGDHNLFHNNNPDRVIAVAYTDEFSSSQLSQGRWSDYSGQDNNSLVVGDLASLFVNHSGFDFRLQPGSPAIDVGTGVSAPAADYDDNPRPQGGGYDVGAYELD